MPNLIANPALNFPLPFVDLWNRIDSTKLMAFESCPRRFFYDYVLGWRPKEPSKDLIYGSAVHAALEHLFEHGHHISNIADAYDKFMLEWRGSFAPDQDQLFAPKDPLNFMQVLIRYVEDNQKFNDYEVIYVEGRENRTAGIIGTVPLNETTEAHFKMDVILRTPKGKILVVEHKTAFAGAFSGKNERGWVGQFQTRTQVALYLHALYCMFPAEDIEGILINGISPGKGENKFIQVPVLKALDMMEAWLFDVNYWLDLMTHNFNLLAECKPTDRVLRAFPKQDQACTSYGGCPMLPFCACWPNPLARADTPPAGTRVEHWNPAAKAVSEKDIVRLSLKGA